MKQLSLLTAIIIMTGILTGCCTAKKTETTQSGNSVSVPGPKVIIYQTVKDYSKLVPITLSDDGKTIVSYPDVKDVYYNSSLAYPTQLNKGYLLDNRGINQNIAFLNISYEAYAKLPVTPTPEELLKMVVDSKPLKIMYSCGVRSAYKDIEKELNSKIDDEDFSSFTRIK
jgi:hypothetical protein